VSGVARYLFIYFWHPCTDDAFVKEVKQTALASYAVPLCYKAAALHHLNSGTWVRNSGVKVVWMLASARALHLPSIICPGISNRVGK